MPVVGRQLELLRVGDPGDRRALRDRPRQAVAGAPERAAGPLPVRHRGRARSTSSTATGWGASARTCSLRGHRPEPAAALPRDRLGAAARADRGVHVVPAVPRVRRRAAQARGARGHGRRQQHPRVHAMSVDARARVPRRARADRGRAADRRADRQGDPRAADVPRRRRRRLPERSTARRRRSRAARRSGSGSRRRSARSSSACSTSSTSRRSACTSATTAS